MATSGPVCMKCGFQMWDVRADIGTYCMICRVRLEDMLPGSVPPSDPMLIGMMTTSNPHHGMGQQSNAVFLSELALHPGSVIPDLNSSEGGTINPQVLYNTPIMSDTDFPDLGIQTADQDLSAEMSWLPQTPEYFAQEFTPSGGLQEPTLQEPTLQEPTVQEPTLQEPQSFPTQSASPTGRKGSKPPRQVKAYSCETCRQRKAKCQARPKSEGKCDYCWRKGLECKSTGVDRRTNKTNQRELQAIAEKYRQLGVVLLETLRHVGGLSSRDPLDAVVFPTLAVNPVGSRLKDVRDAKAAVETAGIELLGCLHGLCQQTYFRERGVAEITRYIDDAKKGKFDPKLLHMKDEYVQPRGREAKQKLHDAPDTAPYAVVAQLELGHAHESSNADDQGDEQMVDSTVKNRGDDLDREREKLDQQPDDVARHARWTKDIHGTWVVKSKDTSVSEDVVALRTVVNTCLAEICQEILREVS
ncbi:hypothetical protein SLS62_002087 [Diatrype stigma]|uniref:Zn(2)-C6 fungal-type domain-containing protein n=1 Tax=Diatrype stigma TaxID=117547 RepID=A0AAN9UYR9_9PEZI